MIDLISMIFSFIMEYWWVWLLAILIVILSSCFLKN